jgi:hypothetical protein
LKAQFFTSRGACMGQVAGEVVAAAFGCFNPKVVVPAVEAGWPVTSREAILERSSAAWAIIVVAAADHVEPCQPVSGGRGDRLVAQRQHRAHVTRGAGDDAQQHHALHRQVVEAVAASQIQRRLDLA